MMPRRPRGRPPAADLGLCSGNVLNVAVPVQEVSVQRTDPRKAPSGDRGEFITRIPVISRPAISRAERARPSSMMLFRWSLAPACDLAAGSGAPSSSSSVSFIGPAPTAGHRHAARIGFVTAAVAAPNSLAVRAGLDARRGRRHRRGGRRGRRMLVAMCTEPGCRLPARWRLSFVVWPHDGDPEVIDGGNGPHAWSAGGPTERFGEGLCRLPTAPSYGGGITVYAGPGSACPRLSASPTISTGGCRGARSSRRPPPLPAKGSPRGRRLRVTSCITGDSLFAWDPQTAALLLHSGGGAEVPGEGLPRPPSTGSETPAPGRTSHSATWPLPSPRTRRTAAASRHPGRTRPDSPPRRPRPAPGAEPERVADDGPVCGEVGPGDDVAAVLLVRGEGSG